MIKGHWTAIAGLAATAMPPPAAWASRTYNVSSGASAGARQAGDDANPGTDALPFKTLSNAVAALQSSDTLVVRGGEYSVHGACAVSTFGGGRRP